MAGPPAVSGTYEVLGDLLDAAVDEIGDHEAYVDGGRRLTFGGWVEAADSVAAHLADHGVGRGDVVAMHLPNSLEYAIAYVAAARLGAIATGINPRLGPTEIDGIVARCRPAVVLSDTLVAAGSVIGSAELMAAAASGTRPRRAGRASADDPICIIWTSGTTGMPKGAWFDHRNQAAAVASAGAMTHRFDRRLGALPFAHAGYMAKLWEQFAMGVAMVLAPTPFTAETMLDVMVDERITVGAGAPTQWAKLLELSGVASADFSALRLGLVATAPAPPELVARVSETLGCPLVVRYAMTESPSITGTEPDDPPDVQFRTVGRPQEGMSVEVVDDDGRQLPVGEIGRVRVRGACVMRGYWGDPERTAEVLEADATLRSSDLGSFDRDGNLTLAGRIDDMYLRGGYNVYPVEVEQVLDAHPAVSRVVVVGRPTPVIGEIGVAVVVPADAANPPLLEELRVWVRDRLADYKAPDDLVLVDDLPLTPMLKVDRIAVAADVASRPA